MVTCDWGFRGKKKPTQKPLSEQMAPSSPELHISKYTHALTLLRYSSESKQFPYLYQSKYFFLLKMNS